LSDVGDRIKKQRELLNLTQLELANKIGINNSVLSRIEAGKRPVEDNELVLFVNFFDVKSDYLLGLTDDSSPIPTKQLATGNDVYVAWLGGPPEEMSEEEAEHLKEQLEMFRSFKEKRKKERDQEKENRK